MAMAGVLADDLITLVKVSVKTRADTFTDQFNRIFVMKICFVSAMVMSVSYFKDSMNCIVHEEKIDTDFVASACWIQGLYVYKEIYESNHPESYHFGMPRRISHDGITPSGKLCPTITAEGIYQDPEECKPMTKMFFLQYQYMPFYICVIGMLYYMPYLLYLACNDDMTSLHATVKEDGKKKDDDDDDGDGDKSEDVPMTEDDKAEKIAQTYFKRSKPGRATSMRLHIILNILVKIAYIGVGLFAFFGTDHIMNGQYFRYGQRWVQWTGKNNSQKYDYTADALQTRAGDELLPSFGYCEIIETAEDKLTIKNNIYKFQCELSQDVLYQYCLFVVWMVMVVGLVLSALGLLMLLIHYLLSFVVMKDGKEKVYDNLYFREIEYLEYVRSKSIPLHKKVCELLKESPDITPLTKKKAEAYEMREVQEGGRQPLMKNFDHER